MKSIITLAATLTLATTLTLTACEEKKKQDGTTTTTTEPAAEAATQQPATQEAVAEKPAERGGESQTSGEINCDKIGPPQTIEAVFLGGYEGSEEYLLAFRLANGDEITLGGEVPDNVKEGDKVSVTFKEIEVNEPEMGLECVNLMSMISMKKIGQ